MSGEKKVEEFQFKTEMEQLLHLLTHSLYTHREIFLRELISNASDALSKLHFASLTDNSVLGDDGELKIQISLDEEKKTFSIRDNGIGMTHDELIENIGTVAQSGTTNFVNQLSGDQQKDLDMIGRFGVGFYSVFMVADEVSVTTRSYKDDKAHKWVSKGTGTYTIEAVEEAPRGTEISFTFKEEAEEFASKWRIESIIRKYSDFVSFAIFVNDDQVNKSTAIWARPKSEITDEEYNEFYKYLAHKNDDPMEHFHYSVEAPAQFKSILFIPSAKEDEWFSGQMDTSLHLYVKRVFIQDDCKDLLPQWLRFVKGVVDSEDLPLNISREVTQNSPVMEKINKYLVRKLLGEFKNWAEKDTEKYEKFWELFGHFIKEGIHVDFVNKDKLVELYRCNSSKNPEKLVSLAEYVERMPEDQKSIYYVYGKNQAVIENSPNLEYFRKNDIEVLYLYDEIDDFLMPGIMQYKEKELISIDKAEIDADSSDDKDQEESIQQDNKDKLIELFKEVLGEKVSDVVESKRLVDSACTLVAPKDSMNAHMERMMKMMNQEFEASRKILEINTKNTLIQNLSKIQEKFPEEAILKDTIEQLYEGASLLEGSLEDPSQMVPRMMQMMEKLSAFYLSKLEA